MSKIAVGMSGGVDSSVTAFLLKEAGFDVIGLFMKNWEEEEGPCPALQDYDDALSVAETLKIPLYAFNFSKEYWDQVFTGFLEDLKKGFTPNPDIFCNKEIKFNVLLQKAKDLGALKLATGHYARIGENGTLLKGLDGNKDQSYFLYMLQQPVLEEALFPLGTYCKEEIRAIAKKANLSTHDKKDSTGICFIGKRNFKDFIKYYISPAKGVFKTPEGEIVGEHDGAWYYTIGQRKGMQIGGKGEAWFVLDKDVSTNVVTVGQGENHPLLMATTCTADTLSWTHAAPSTPYRCMAKVRYRQEDQPCTITSILNGVATVIFDHPQRAITPRQAIVFYQGDCCLGGGLIIKACHKTDPVLSF